MAKSNFKRAKTAAGRKKQQAAIKKYYARLKDTNEKFVKEVREDEQTIQAKFPFWARLKISKNRTTLVIDEDKVVNKKTNREEEAYVHREATHTYRKDFEPIVPNPDASDSEPMYLKRPSKLPKQLFKPHNKELAMPDFLKKRYEKNNKQ